MGIRRNSAFSAGGGGGLWEILKLKFRGKLVYQQEFRIFCRQQMSFMRNPHTKVSRKKRISTPLPRFPQPVEEFYEKSSKSYFSENTEICRNFAFYAGGGGVLWEILSVRFRERRGSPHKNSAFSATEKGVLWEILILKFLGKRRNPKEFRVFRGQQRSFMRNPQTKVSQKTRISTAIPHFPQTAKEFYEKSSN